MADERQIVHVVDDDKEVREGIRRLMSSVGLQCKTYDSAEQFLKKDMPDCPSCLVLDVRMPGMSGMELQRRLVARNNTLPIIVMSGHGEIAMAVECVQRGALTFLEKPARPQVLLDWVQKALKQHAERRQVENKLSIFRSRFDQLTEKEREVMDHLVSGKTTKQIAAAMGLSPKTIDYHRGRLLETMEAASLAELVQVAILLNTTPDAHSE